MLLPDVNVLVYAFREVVPAHQRYRDWLNSIVASSSAFAVSDHVLAAFLRITTNPRIFDPPAPIELALGFVESLRHRPNAIHIAPGPRHWDIFAGLCRDLTLKGNLVPDAWLAALAIEHGCEFVTTDRDFARFVGLRWRHPLDG